jgi:hypothetical protein
MRGGWKKDIQIARSGDIMSFHDHMTATRFTCFIGELCSTFAPAHVYRPYKRPVFKHIDAWIELNDERVAEYDVTVKENAPGVPESVSCWIPSTANQVWNVSTFMLDPIDD